MRRFLLLISTLLFAGAAATRAQDNPQSNEARSDYAIVKNFIVRAAEKMPEEGYAFKPTPEVRNYGQLIGHIADDQYRYCSAVRGQAKSSRFEQNTPPKAEMVTALKAAFAYCDETYAPIVDAYALDRVNFSGRAIPKIVLLLLHSGHAWEHYGNIVVYMRLRGLVPPSSEPNP